MKKKFVNKGIVDIISSQQGMPDSNYYLNKRTEISLVYL